MAWNVTHDEIFFVLCELHSSNLANVSVALVTQFLNHTAFLLNIIISSFGKGFRQCALIHFLGYLKVE